MGGVGKGREGVGEGEREGGEREGEFGEKRGEERRHHRDLTDKFSSSREWKNWQKEL